jgi:hypothetical protein
MTQQELDKIIQWVEENSSCNPYANIWNCYQIIDTSFLVDYLKKEFSEKEKKEDEQD